MKPSYFLLLSTVALPVLLNSPMVAFAEPAPGARIVTAEAEDRVNRARELLEQAQRSLQQAEETGGDVRAARGSVTKAMNDLRSAETTGGANTPVVPGKTQGEPSRPAPRQAQPNPPAAGGQPKPYQPPAVAKKPEAPAAKPGAPAPKPATKPAAKPASETKPAPDRKPAPPVQAETKPKAQPAPGVARPDAQRPGNDRPRPDARPPRPSEADVPYRDEYGYGAPPRDGYSNDAFGGDREISPPPGAYRDDPRPYRPSGRFIDGGRASERQIEETFRAAPVQRIDRGYSINEIRRDPRVRDMVQRVDLDAITFNFASDRVPEDQVRKLQSIGRAIGRVVDRYPDAVFLIEGHTDAVGTDLANLELSDRRAASVAGILSDYFGIPRDALISQGYGKRFLKVPTEAPERQNRRVTIRNITPLLQGR